MPFPLAHPVAVLPFRRWCPRQLSLVGLVIGSVTPDAGYTLRHLDFDVFTHSPAGSLVFCLPVGMIATLIVFLFRQALAGSLPAPHRQALLTLCAAPRPDWWRLALSVFIGTWTHIAFDALTHESAARGYGAESFDQIAATIHGKWFYQVTWMIVSLVSMFALAVAYLLFLRRTTGSFRVLDFSDRRRIALWLTLIVAPYIVIAAISFGLFTRHGFAINKHAIYATFQPYLLWMMGSLFIFAFILHRRARAAATPPATKPSSNTPARPG